MNFMKLTEMQKLETMLVVSGIPFQQSIHPLTKTPMVFYPSAKNRVCDVVCHQFSYGYKMGLLEIMGLTTEEETMDGVLGWLTSRDVFERISRHWEENKERR